MLPLGDPAHLPSFSAWVEAVVTGEEVEGTGQVAAVAGEAVEEEEDGEAAEVSEEDAVAVVTAAAAADGEETEEVDSEVAEEEDLIAEVIFMYHIFNYVQNTNTITHNLLFHCQRIDISNLFFGFYITQKAITIISMSP